MKSRSTMKATEESAMLHYAKVLLVSKAQPTLKEDNVPALFREPGVKTGYRAANQSWAYYLASIFHVNNETVNVWSHLIGCLIMLYQCYGYSMQHDVWLDERRRIVYLFILCCVGYTLLSALAHAIHSRSEVTHYTSFQVDYGGVGLYTYGTGMMAFYVSCLNEPYYTTMEPVFLPIITLMTWFTCLSCSLGKLLYFPPYPFRRKLWNICPVAAQLIFCTFGSFKRYFDCFHDNACSMNSMSHHSICIVFFVVSIFFFSSHLPETIWNGKCDIVGQGHQIFHVLIVITSYLQIWAAEIDVRHLRVPFPRNIPSWPQLFASLLAIFVLDFFTILFLNPFVRRRVEKDKLE